jgi:choline dehydrogenase
LSTQLLDSTSDTGPQDAEFGAEVIANQERLTKSLRTNYDFIVCGSGSSGSVIARRLAENPTVSVLLIEAGGTDDVPAVRHAGQWPVNLGSERDWGFQAQPNPHLNGRSIPLNMGKVLGGGSSINVMIWSRGHKNDWDCFATEAGDTAWSYEAVLNIYRRIEDWHGSPDSAHRGTGGPVFVQPAPSPNPIAHALLAASRSSGMETFNSPNGSMMEGSGGCSLMDVRIREGQRLSVFRSYLYPYMNRPNLTVLSKALVTRILFEGKRATGVEFVHNGTASRVRATSEVVMSMGAVQTPKVLLQSGIGDREQLNSFGIDVVEHLPGVGRNFQDHPGVASCMWEYSQPMEPQNNGAEATFFWKSDVGLDTPDIQVIQGEFPVTSTETAARFNPPASSWILFPCCVRPHSRGQVRLTGPKPTDPVQIHANTFEDERDIRALVKAVELCREIGSSAAFRPFVKREVMPGALTGKALEDFVRDAAVTVWHQSGTAKMGRDSLAVVDGRLRVYGIENLRIADASIMPRVTTGNTMASCVVIGERAGEAIKADHRL